MLSTFTVSSIKRRAFLTWPCGRTAYAQAERDYRVAKAKAILREREKGTAATITLDLVKGDREVSRLCFERDCAEVLYRSALEAIQSTKLQLRLIDAQLSRELGQAGMS